MLVCSATCMQRLECTAALLLFLYQTGAGEGGLPLADTNLSVGSIVNVQLTIPSVAVCTLTYSVCFDQPRQDLTGNSTAVCSRARLCYKCGGSHLTCNSSR